MSLLVHCFPGRIGILNVGFCGGRKNGRTRRKTVEARTRTADKINPHALSALRHSCSPLIATKSPFRPSLSTLILFLFAKLNSYHVEKYIATHYYHANNCKSLLAV